MGVDPVMVPGSEPSQRLVPSGNSTAKTNFHLVSLGCTRSRVDWGFGAEPTGEAPPDPLAGFQVATSSWEGERGTEGKEEKMRGMFARIDASDQLPPAPPVPLLLPFHGFFSSCCNRVCYSSKYMIYIL